MTSIYLTDEVFQANPIGKNNPDYTGGILLIEWFRSTLAFPHNCRRQCRGRPGLHLNLTHSQMSCKKMMDGWMVAGNKLKKLK